MIEAGLCAVYRKQNAAIIERLVAQAREAHWNVALWALDEVAPALRSATLGRGPGAKFPLINRLLTQLDWTGGHLVVADDDVTITRGSVRQLLQMMNVGGLGIAQPAHDRRSCLSHDITRARRTTRARWTTYVEIGPLFAVHPDWLPAVTPFPESFGMGWGIELLWYDLQSSGCRLGVVDDVHMRHLRPPAVEYDAHHESERMLSMVRERGGVALGDLQRVRGRWWHLRKEPGWQVR